MVVVSLIGLLAVLALSRFTTARERAHRSSLQADLRNLASAQEAYFADTQAYAGDLSSLSFTSSEGVTVEIVESSGRGWAATASHPGSPEDCGVYYGNASAPSGITVASEGIVGCS